VSVRQLPDLIPDTKLKLPKQAERKLTSGLTVIAIRRPAVPLVEIRLGVPFGRAPLARATLLSQALFTGTETMSSIDIAAELQAVGGGLSAGLDPDRLLVSGTSLASGMDRMLEILAAVLTDPAYPNEEVATERERLEPVLRLTHLLGPQGLAEADEVLRGLDPEDLSGHQVTDLVQGDGGHHQHEEHHGAEAVDHVLH